MGAAVVDALKVSAAEARAYADETVRSLELHKSGAGTDLPVAVVSTLEMASAIAVAFADFREAVETAGATFSSAVQ